MRKELASGRRSAVMVCLFLTLNFHLKATNYYFSTTQGDDNRTVGQAQNPATPWKSIEKFNAVFAQLNPGDSILFRSGESFYGNIKVTKSGNGNSPFVFASYGTGDKPEITGFFIPSNWTNSGNNTWETTLPVTPQRVNSVLYGGTVRAAGRYPNANASNKGYLNFESAQGTTSITDNGLGNSTNWTGGEVVIRKARWVIDRNIITQHRGNTLFYTTQSGYGGSAGYGYFIQNHPQTLDQDGEWYYQATNSKFGIYSTAGIPTSNVRVGTVANLVSISNQSNITFVNLRFTGANDNAFFLDHAQNIVVKGCDLLYGYNGLTAWSSNNITVESCVISNSYNNACRMEGCDNIVLKANTINSTGAFAGMGDGDSGSYEGLLISGSNQLIEGNTIDSTGYNAVGFRGSNVVVKNNVISNFSFVKDDGSGIYTWNNVSNPPTYTGQVIINNIVLNGIGAGEGTPDPQNRYANGIYMDDNAGGVEISSNTVANCSNYGFYIHNAHDLIIQNNNVYNNAVQLELTHDDIAPYPIRNVTMTGNSFVSKLVTQGVAEFKTNGNDIASFGNFDNNYYSRPFYDDLQIGVLTNVNGSYRWQSYNVDGWKAAYGKDQHSKSSPLSFIPFRVNNYIGSNLLENGNFLSNISGLWITSDANNAVGSWVNNLLNGGSLQLAFSSITGNSNAMVMMNAGTLIAGHQYVLKFTSRGLVPDKTMNVYLRQGQGSYSDLGNHEYFTTTTNRSEHQFVFTPSSGINRSNVVFIIPDVASTVYLDNIELTEANISQANPDDSIRLVYNTAPTSQSFPLSGSYVDMGSTNYNSQINVAGYSSNVLLKKNSTQTPSDEAVVCSATGSILREHWSNVAGNDIASIPLQTPPTSTSQLNIFEASTDFADNYAARVRGYICPPLTGNYTFWIAGDDASELWLSTDSSVSNKTKIAYSASWTSSREWNKYSSQQSASIYLRAGHKYYIEALHKEGAGGDNLAVAWQLPNGTTEAPIPGSRLSPFVPIVINVSNQTIDFPTIGDKTYGDVPFTIAATASSGLPVSLAIASGPATISGNTVTLTGTGNVTVQATQAGNSVYNAAPVVTQSFLVKAQIATGNTCSATGTILREQWNNITGNDIASIPLQTAPASTSQLSLFEAPTDFADNYGARVRGYICPPLTGNYTFWIASDDASELWLSTDSSSSDKVKIAYALSWTSSREWNKYASQQSAAIYLEAGHKYYIEALHKEGAGGDNLAVGWKLPNGTIEAPIPGNRLSPFIITTATLANQTINFPSIGDKTFGDAAFPISANASSGLNVSFSFVSGPATVSGNIVTLTGTGSVTVQASQSGNAAYNAAPSVTQTFLVKAPFSTFTCSATGTILREQWSYISGTDIANIPLQTVPTSTSQLTSFEAPTDFADNYGARVRGFICPPLTGNYTFWIASDDASELWLSTDSSASNKVKIAYILGWTNSREWNKFASQKSTSIYLEAGHKYYIEALHKEGAGGDNLAVAWQLPNGTMEAPIPGSRLSPASVTVISSTPSCEGAGSIVREQWNNVFGNGLINIPLLFSASTVSTLTAFESPSNVADYYVARIRGYICTPISGSYTFWIAADDEAELWLSNSADPSGKTLIANVPSYTGIREWNKYASQKSVSIYLQAGQLYYVEARHREGAGEDNLAVAWQLPNGILEAPIPGIRLVPYSATSAKVGISNEQITLKQSDVGIKLLEQNDNILKVYPNPMVTSASVDVQLKESEGITLDLLDEQGRIIKRLANGLKANTSNKFTINRAGLANGIYIIRLVTASNIISKKVIVH